MGPAILRFDKLPKEVSLYLFFVDLRTQRRLGSRLRVLAPSVRRKVSVWIGLARCQDVYFR